MICPNWTLAFIPLYMLQTAALGLGVGIIVSSLTTKYRDAIFDLMYDKSTIYLQRKFDIYDNHFYK